MKALFTAMFWVAAAALAVLLLMRVCRGKPLMISRSSSRILRMALFLLVVLGVGSESAPAQTEGSAVADSRRRLLEDTPKILQSDAIVALWRRQGAQATSQEFYRDLEMLSLASGPVEQADLLPRVISSIPFQASVHPIVQSILRARFSSTEESAQITAVAVLQALEVMESVAAIHPAHIRLFYWAVPVVMQTDPEGALRILERLHTQARMHEAFVAASFGVQPYQARAWMSKAGAPTEVKLAEARAVGRIVGALPYEYATRNAGLWDREGRARVVHVSGEGFRVEGRGQSLPVAPGAEIEIARLTAWRTQTATVVNHDWLGRIDLPANRLFFVFQLPDLLNADAQVRVRGVVEEALLGSEEALSKLERSLPFTHKAILAGLKEQPQAKGASGLRLLLKLFD